MTIKRGKTMWITLLILQIATLIYHQITTRIDLFPFNAVRFYSEEERRVETTVNGIIMFIPIILTLINSYPIWIAIGGCIWLLISIGAVLNWWIPYFTGREIYKMKQDETWEEVYNKIFSKTITILPHIKNNPRPNVEHMILHTLILSSAILSWVYVFRIGMI